jgi:hypothetical protein
MKRYLTALGLALAASLAFAAAIPAFAADKGGPPVRVDAAGAVKPMWTGCFVSAAGSGVFAEMSAASASVKAFMAGAGCDIQSGKLVFGASADYGFGESESRFVAITGRAGYTLNPHLLLYGLVSLTMDGRSPNLQDSALAAGVGVETYIDRNLSIFLEATAGLNGYGSVKDLELSTVKGGVRYRF